MQYCSSTCCVIDASNQIAIMTSTIWKSLPRYISTTKKREREKNKKKQQLNYNNKQQFPGDN